MISFTEKPTELDNRLPLHTQAAVSLAFNLDEFAEREDLWGQQPVTLARMIGEGNGYEFTVALSQISTTTPTGSTVDMIKEVKPADLDGPRGNHLGFLLMTEAFDTDTDTEDAVALLNAGEHLPEGEHLRMVLGVLTAGWTVMLCRARGDVARALLAEPGEAELLPDYTALILDPLADLNRRFAG